MGGNFGPILAWIFAIFLFPWDFRGHNFEVKKWRGIHVGGILSKLKKNVGFQSEKTVTLLFFTHIHSFFTFLL